jgi:parallel beta-helix repeat protein
VQRFHDAVLANGSVPRLEQLCGKKPMIVAPGPALSTGSPGPLATEGGRVKRGSPRWRATMVAAALAAASLTPTAPRIQAVPAPQARTLYVDQRHREASDSGPGTASQPFKTISAAAALAQAGDTVRVAEGIYRERVAPARGGEEHRPIRYVAAVPGKVVIRGSEIWKPRWTAVEGHDGVYFAKLDPATLPNSGSPDPFAPFRARLNAAPGWRRLTLGQVFVDGRPLEEVDDKEEVLSRTDTWLLGEWGQGIYVHCAPPARLAERVVEVTVRDRIFAPRRRGLGYIHVQGFVMEHCANQFPLGFWSSDSPQAGALGCRGGHHWVIEGNVIRYAKSIGLDCGWEGSHDLDGSEPQSLQVGHHVIRNNVVSDNGACGIAGARTLRTQIVGNTVERNNSIRFEWVAAPEIAGIKVHGFIGGLIAENLIRDNEAHGIWIDNVYSNARVTRNVIVGNRDDGIFVELGGGPVVIDNNIIAHSRPGFYRGETRGDGLYTLDASGVVFAHNLVFGCANFGVYSSMWRTFGFRPYAVYPDDIQSWETQPLRRELCANSNEMLRNNIVVDNKGGALNLPFPGDLARNNTSDANLLGASAAFVSNRWGGTNLQGILRSARRVLGSSPQTWIGKDEVSDGVRLGLGEWRTLLGYDRQSRVSTAVSASLDRDLNLTLRVDDTLLQMKGPVVDGIDSDFEGRPLPPGARRPGPFGRLERGQNRIKLWPVPGVR